MDYMYYMYDMDFSYLFLAWMGTIWLWSSAQKRGPDRPMYDEFAPFIDGPLIELQPNLYIPLYDWYKPSATTQGIVPYVINIYIIPVFGYHIYNIYIICTIYIYIHNFNI